MFGLNNWLFLVVPMAIVAAMWFFISPISIYAVAALWLLVYGYRIIIRHNVAFNMRKNIAGDTVWFQLTPNSKKILGRDVDKSKSLISAVDSVLSSLTAKSDRRMASRGIVNVVWAKAKGKNGVPRLVCFLGVNSAAISNAEGVLASLGDAAGAEIKRLRRAPKFPVGSVSFAKERGYRTSEVTDGKQATISPIAQLLLNDEDFYGHVILSIEEMRASERRRLKAHISETGARESGDSKQYSGLAARSSDWLVESCFRTSMAVVTKEGGPRKASSVLTHIASSMSESGVIVENGDPATENNRRTSGYYIVYIIASALSILFMQDYVNPYAVGALAVLTSIAGIPALVNAQFMGHHQLEQYVQKGEVVVPSYSWFSMRWRYLGFINYYQREGNTDQLSMSRHANPSAPQVVHWHKVPLASYIAMPEVKSDSDAVSDPIPEIGVSSDYESKFSGDDIFLGLAKGKQFAYLPLNRLQYQMFILGGTDSGKSNFSQLIYHDASYHSFHRTNGYKITPIWGETKGRGAYDTYDLVKDYDPLFIDCNNPTNNIRIALEGPRLGEVVGGHETTVQDVLESSTRVFETLKYMWKDQIMASSEQYIKFSVRAALLLTPEELERLELQDAVNINKPNIISLAYIILGRDPEYQVSDMLNHIKEEYSRHPKGTREQLLAEAITAVGDTKSSHARQATAAPGNKLTKMREVRWLWEPSADKIDVYTHQLIRHGKPVIFNSGPYRSEGATGDGEDEVYLGSLGAELTNDVMLGLSYNLWQDIKRFGGNWEERGIFVPMFFDEVSHIAHDYDNMDIVTEVINEGRSFGAGLYGATQNIGRVDESVANQLSNAMGKAWFYQNSSDAVDYVMKQLGSDTQYSRKNVADLPVGKCIVTIRASKTSTEGPFTCTVPYAPTWADLVREHGDIKSAAVAYQEQVAEKNSEAAVW